MSAENPIKLIVEAPFVSCDIQYPKQCTKRLFSIDYPQPLNFTIPAYIKSLGICTECLDQKQLRLICFNEKKILIEAS